MNDDLLKGLNKEQREAVLHDKGPLLIIAGAGTGKTAVVTRRIAHLITSKKARPEEILALTFTDKAAQEMEERVDQLVPYGFIDTWISTFHAFGDRVLRDNALELGIPSDYRVLSTPEQVIFMNERLFEFGLKHYLPLGNPTRHIEELLGIFSKLKDEDIGPNLYLDWVNKEKGKRKKEKVGIDSGQARTRPNVSSERMTMEAGEEELEKHLEVATAYKKYQEFMLQEGCLDFGDQITMALNLFRDKPSVLKKYQDQFKYILVDEFQDTNFAQNELVKILTGKNGNITVVGDDDQSIYRFRGAAISNILDFTKTYSKAKQVVLTKNYRSSQAILNASYKLIKHNNPDRLEVKNNINKKLEAATGIANVQPKHLHFDTVSSEADYIAEAIKSKIQNTKNKINYKDIAILVRGNAQAEPFIQALSAKGVPSKFAGTKGLYSRSEVQLILAFVRSIVDPHDSLSLYHLLTSEVYDVPVEDAVVLTNHAKRNNRALSEILSIYSSSGVEQSREAITKGLSTRSSNIAGTLEEDSLDKISIILEDLEKYREDSKKDTAGQVIYSFLNETGYLKKLVSRIDKTAEAETKIRNIAKFFEKVTEFEYVSVDKTLINFKRELGSLIDAGDDPATAEVDPDLDAVNILTVHKSKGLEFKVVFVVGLVAGRFPSRRRSDPINIPEELIKERLPEGDFHLAEERRLFYVALTRSKEELFLTSADDYGGKRIAKVSQFVMETLEKPSVDAVALKLDKIEQIKKFAKSDTKELVKKFYTEDKILCLNPHQIDDYLSCPLKFKFIHILEIPILKFHPVIYGSAIHKAVQEYFVRKSAGYKVTAEDLINVFTDMWASEGWVTREHEEKRFEEGKKTLRKFFETEEKLNRLPSQVESKFQFDLNIDGVRTRIRGRYDAVYSEIRNPNIDLPEMNFIQAGIRNNKEDSNIQNTKEDNSDSFVEIRDFKTSNVTDQKKADEKAKGNRQISIYALSWEKMHGKIPEVVSLHFIDSGLSGNVSKKEKDLEKVTGEIATVVKGIVADDFKAKPGFGECQRCAYLKICPKSLVE